LGFRGFREIPGWDPNRDLQPPDGNPGCFRFHPWFTLGSSVVVETRVELTRRFWFIFANWGNFSALGTSRLFSEL
jgi:hypothetical protein